MATTVGPTLDLPVRLTVGDGPVLDVGRLDITVAAHASRGDDGELHVTTTGADNATLRSRLADLLDHAAAQLRATDTTQEVTDAAPR